MKKTSLLIAITITLVLIGLGSIGKIALIPVQKTNLGTLTFAFPIVLALIERFNEIFVVIKKSSENITQAKADNKKRCSIASFIIGLLLSLAGFRILGTFVEVITPFEIGGIKMYLSLIHI